VTLAELSWYEILFRLGIAAGLGALVGLERESAGQDAGFRTHLLLAMGSALFGVVSVGAFDDFITDRRTNVQVDVTRIASYVAAGVGFIGGGAIIKHAGSVRGITTAASLWAAAAIGLSAGVGLWTAAVIGTGLSLLALAGLKPLSDWVGRRAHPPRSLVVVLDRPERGIDVLRAVQEEMPAEIRAVHLGQGQEPGTSELAVEFWERPDAETTRRIIQRLRDEFDDAIRAVTLRS
jgi:putative Mg2+ transporter-C (MgtC) family protein